MNQNNFSQQKPVNPLENFDAVYERERNLQREFERIELAYAKTAEKYKDYSDCLEFAHYIKTIEKIFTEARIRKWGSEKVKDVLIQSKIKIISQESSIDEDVLKMIYADFKKTGTNIGKINEVIEVLSRKYEDQEECVEFISYIGNILINFSDFKEQNLDLDDMRSRLIQARMKVLSSDGEPDLKTLEDIYKEFKEEMEK